MASNDRGRPVAIFWDFETCPLAAPLTASETVESICRAANLYGSVTVFQLFLRTFDEQEIPSRDIRSQLELSGVAVIECSGENASSRAIQDLLLFAVDNSPPATIMLISDNPDYTYTISQLKRRKYNIVLIVSSREKMPRDLGTRADVVLNWDVDIVEAYLSSKPHRQALGQGIKSPRGISMNKKDYTGKYSPKLSTSKPLASSSRSSLNNSENQSISSLAAQTSWRRNTDPSAAPALPRPGLVADSFVGATETIFNPQPGLPSSPLARKHELANPSSVRKGIYRPPVPVRIDHTPMAMEGYRNSNKSTHDVRHDSLTTWSSAVFPENATESSPTSFSSGRFEFRDTPSRTTPQGSLGLSFDLSQAKNGGESSSSSVLDSFESRSASRTSVGFSNELARIEGLVLPPPTHSSSPYQETQATSGLLGDSRIEIHTEQCPTQNFSPLIEELSRLRADGNGQPLRSLVGIRLRRDAYMSAGVADFGQYVALAESMGLVELGGTKGTAWIALKSR